jgi:hypothetical protein
MEQNVLIEKKNVSEDLLQEVRRDFPRENLVIAFIVMKKIRY